MVKAEPIFLIDQIYMTLLQFLQGKKTYLVVAVGVIVNGLYAMGYIPAVDLPVVNTVLAFLGLAALRSTIANASKPN